MESLLSLAIGRKMEAGSDNDTHHDHTLVTFDTDLTTQSFHNFDNSHTDCVKIASDLL